ncbi:MAG: hypothetical protein AAGF35_15445 [Pseudomonadota bacterium]
MKTGTKLGLLALLIVAATTVYWFYLVRQVNLPDDRTVFVVVFLTAVALGIAAFVKGTSIPGGIPPAIAIVMGLFFTFTIYISPQELAAEGVIQVGDTIPQFTASDENGVIFDSRTLDDHLVLIKFFRAHW